MKFVHPEVLYFLSAIIIPIIIHLFNFRRYKRIFFTNVKFLKEIQEDKRAKSKLKNILILIFRTLAIIFIVLAFAQPYIPPEDIQVLDKKENAISIYVDNSFSMNSVGTEGELIEIAKIKAKEIIGFYSPTDLFQLMTNDLEAHQNRFISREDFEDLLTEINISPSTKKISNIIARQKQTFINHKDRKNIIYLISDFQKSMIDFDKIESDTSVDINLVKLSAQNTNNVMLDTCWFTSPIFQLNQQCEFVVRLKNLSDDHAENVPIQLSIDEKQKALASANLKPNSSTDIILSFINESPGWKQGKISIKDYPINFDDDYYFSYYIQPNLQILCINGENENQYINALYNSDPFFQLNNALENNINYGLLQSFNVIILHDIKAISSGLTYELVKFVEQGGTIIVFPNPEAEIISYNELFTKLNTNIITGIEEKENVVSKMNVEAEIFKNVFEKIPKDIDLPKAKNYLLFSHKTTCNEEYILKLKNGSSFFSRYEHKKGEIYLCSSPLNLDFTNLSNHAIFVPMMYKITLLSSSAARLSYTIGKDNFIELAHDMQLQKDDVYRIIKKDFEIIPEQKFINNKINLFLHDQIRDAGLYTLTRAKKSLVSILGFNYDRLESNLIYADEAFIKDQIGNKNIKLIASTEKNLTITLQEINKGTSLWKLCITFVLIFLGVEIIMLRFF